MSTTTSFPPARPHTPRRRKPNLRSQLWARVVVQAPTVHTTQSTPDEQTYLVEHHLREYAAKGERMRRCSMVYDLARGKGSGEFIPPDSSPPTGDEEVQRLMDVLLHEMRDEGGLSDSSADMLSRTEYGKIHWLWMCRCGGGLNPSEWCRASPAQLGLGSSTRRWWYHGDPTSPTTECGRCLKNEKYYDRRSVLLWEGPSGEARITTTTWPSIEWVAYLAALLHVACNSIDSH